MIGIATLIPITWMAFLAFARPLVRPLTTVYIAANAILLIPTRHPDIVGILSLALMAGLAYFDRKRLSHVVALRTREGTFVRIMLLMPLAVLVGRSLNLYDISSLFGAGLFAAVATLVFEVLPTNIERVRSKVAAQWLPQLRGLCATARTWLT